MHKLSDLTVSVAMAKDHLSQLPEVLQHKIRFHLPWKAARSLRATSKYWRKFIAQPHPAEKAWEMFEPGLHKLSQAATFKHVVADVLEPVVVAYVLGQPTGRQPYLQYFKYAKHLRIVRNKPFKYEDALYERQAP